MEAVSQEEGVVDREKMIDRIKTTIKDPHFYIRFLKNMYKGLKEAFLSFLPCCLK